METDKASLPHADRTATEPRGKELHPVILHKIEHVNDTIKLFNLRIKDEKKGVKVGQLCNYLVILFNFGISTRFFCGDLTMFSFKVR